MEGNTVYTLTYDANGGEGAPGVATKNGNEDFAIFTVDSLTPTRPGFVFSGWSFSPNAEAAVYAGDLFTVTSQNTTVYAVWTEAQSGENIAEDSVSENTEPLGVFTSADDSAQSQFVGDAIAFAFIGAAIILGLIALLLFRQRQPRIISKKEEE